MYMVPTVTTAAVVAASSIRSDSVAPALSPKAEYPYLYNKYTVVGRHNDNGMSASSATPSSLSPEHTSSLLRTGEAISHQRVTSLNIVKESSPSTGTRSSRDASYLPVPQPGVLISRPSATIWTGQEDLLKSCEPQQERNASPTRSITSPLDQFKIANAAVGPSRSRTPPASNTYRPRASSVSPLRSTRVAKEGPTDFNLTATAVKGMERSCSVPRQRHTDKPQQEPPGLGSTNRFSALVEERRQHYDQRTRGRSLPQQPAFDPTRELHLKPGFVRPVSSTAKLSSHSTTPAKSHLTKSIGPSCQSQKPDPDTASFTKCKTTAIKKESDHISSLESCAMPKRYEPQPRQPSITVRELNFVEAEEMRQTSARYENSTIHKMLSAKRPTRPQSKPAETTRPLGDKKTFTEPAESTRPLVDKKTFTEPPESTRPLVDKKTFTEPDKPKVKLTNNTSRAASPYGDTIRSYGFAERLSNQLARTEADRKSSIGSSLATSVATLPYTTHPVFGYSKQTNAETAPVAQQSESKQRDLESATIENEASLHSNSSRKDFVLSKATDKIKQQDSMAVFDNKASPILRHKSASTKTFIAEATSQLASNFENHESTDESEESESSCMRRSRHLIRVMRPASSTLMAVGSPSTQKNRILGYQHHQQQQQQQQQPCQQKHQLHEQHQHHRNERDNEPATRNRERAAAVTNFSPNRKRAHKDQARDHSGERPQISSQKGQQTVFSMGQNPIDDDRHHYRPRHTTSRHYTANNRTPPENQYNQACHNLENLHDDSHLTQRLDHSILRAQDDIHKNCYDEFVNDVGYIATSDKLQHDEKNTDCHEDTISPPLSACKFHQDLELHRPKSVGNREPGGVYGHEEVSSFMRVVEPPGAGATDEPTTQQAQTIAWKKSTATRPSKNAEITPPAQYESFRSLEEKRKLDAPSGPSFLAPHSSAETGSGIASAFGSASSKDDSAFVERSQNEQALEDLLHEKVKRMGKFHAEAMDESSDSRADAFMWLHQKYGTKAPTVNMKAIKKAKARAMNAKADGNQKKAASVSEAILEEDEDVFSGLDDMSSFSRKASPAPFPRNEISQPRLAKAPKITVRNTSKAIGTPKDDKQSVRTFQEALFSGTIISDLTMSLTTDKQKRRKESTPKPMTTYTGIEEVPSNDDSSDASHNGCKHTASVVAGFGQTIGKSIVASLQKVSCNLPEKIPVPECTVEKARCEDRINEPWGTPNEEKDESLISAEDNSTVTDTLLNEMEKRVWAAWDRRRSRPSHDETTAMAKSLDESGALHVDTASTASSENREEGHYERSEAKAELLQFAQKAVDLYGIQFPNTASLAKLHSIDSSTNRPKPIVSLADGTPVSKLSTTMTFEDQTMLENFSSALKNTGVEVLKLGRKNKWQVRYLTVSKEVTKLSTGGVAGDIGQCPMALLWPKSFKGHNFSVATIKENGRGGVLFKHLKKVRPTASNEFYDHHLPKKLKASFPDFAGVVLDYLHDSGARQLHLCFKSSAESHAFITAMLIIREATERSEGDESLHGPAMSSAMNSIAMSEQ